MGMRSDLHEKLVNCLGNNRVYFQPPETLKLVYPCIIYTWDGENPKYADDCKYNIKKKYTVTIIERNPDSKIPDYISAIPYSSLSRRFTSDNLYHTVYSIIF